jgi:hypothetical protein
LLRASRSAVVRYEAAVATAAAAGLGLVANLLTISLAEEWRAVDRLASMVRLIHEE